MPQAKVVGLGHQIRFKKHGFTNISSVVIAIILMTVNPMAKHRNPFMDIVWWMANKWDIFKKTIKKNDPAAAIAELTLNLKKSIQKSKSSVHERVDRLGKQASTGSRNESTAQYTTRLFSTSCVKPEAV